MSLFNKLQSPLLPTKKWSKFFILVVYFTILVCLYWYYDLTFLRDTFDLSSINQEFFKIFTSPYSIGITLFFPIVLAIAVEFSAAWAIVIGETFLVLSSFILPILTGTPLHGESFGYFIFGLMMFGFWLIPVSGGGLLIRFVIEKLNSKVLVVIALLIIILGIFLPITRIKTYGSNVSLEGCIHSSDNGKHGSGISYKCFEELAKINNDPKICNYYLEKYNTASSEEKGKMLSTGFTPSTAINSCIDAFANVKKDVSVCNLLQEYQWGNPTRCYWNYAWSATDINQCSTIPNGTYDPGQNKQACIAAVIKLKKDYTLCSQITRPDLMYVCK